ncbi:MAG: N-acyl homoserine lactone hydrolase [Rhodospirillaceae bacterium]|nr:N-acyl homoserine lactone hydrolase [Rhodospirillaceae bacterium]
MADYSIWVLEYAAAPRVDMGSVIYGAHDRGSCKMPYAYVVLQSRDHVAMVDIGYNHADFGAALAVRFGAGDWHGPREVLGLCGLRPEDVDTIFITHAHFDHFGNIEAFPNARFYVAEREIEKSIWALSLPERMNFLATSIDPGDLLKAAELARSGRLVLVREDLDDVLPGIDLRIAPDTHSFASLWVAVRNDGLRNSGDVWILAGDLVYAYDNIGGLDTGAAAGSPYMPVGFAIGSQANLVLATEEMLKLVSYERRRVVPVHEERLKQVFPSRRLGEGLSICEICLADRAESKLA